MIKDIRALNLQVTDYGTVEESLFNVDPTNSEWSTYIAEIIDALIISKGGNPEDNDWDDFYEQQEFYDEICKAISTRQEVFFIFEADGWDYLISVSQSIKEI